jgi:23S rRNA A2030 N6-methylase RlmJ
MSTSPLSYDHHKKAGNQGDICKHVALVAALDETISVAAEIPFRFADLYAGYAKNPLLEGHEWPNGIGKISGAKLFEGNRHVRLWAAFSGLNQVPRLGGGYPGSAWFAMQVCMHWNRAFELSLWDVGPQHSRIWKQPFRMAITSSTGLPLPTSLQLPALILCLSILRTKRNSLGRASASTSEAWNPSRTF